MPYLSVSSFLAIIGLERIIRKQIVEQREVIPGNGVERITQKP